MVAAGGFTTLNGAAQNRIVRLNTDGTPDATFSFNVGGGFNSSVFSVALQQDGSIAVGGLFTTLQGATSNYIARLFPNGTPDTAFTTNVGTFNSDLRAVAVQADGKIVVGGFFTTLNGVTSNRIARLNADGTRDTAFTTNLGTGFDAYLLSVAVQSDGKIVAGGAFATLNGATNNHIRDSTRMARRIRRSRTT